MVGGPVAASDLVFIRSKGEFVGLLDELEHEAQRRKSDEESAVALKASRESAYRTTLEPAMGTLLAYLQELVAKLKLLQPKVAIRHNLPGYGEVVGYVEHEYEVHENRMPRPRRSPSRSFARWQSDVPRFRLRVSTALGGVCMFQRHRLGAPLAPVKDATGEVVSATFKAKGRIPLTAVFSADTTTGQLRLTFTNFDDLAAATKNVAPENVNEALYDEIGRYVMREPTRLLREDLPEDYRSQLRAGVQQQEVKRRWNPRSPRASRRKSPC